jgi:hypothetical protein
VPAAHRALSSRRETGAPWPRGAPSRTSRSMAQGRAGWNVGVQQHWLVVSEKYESQLGW